MATATADHKLKLQVAPHIVEDLGLNLYTSLPKVLVEFIANAYDADSPDVLITLDHGAIDDERTRLRQLWKERKEKGEDLAGLASQTLKPSLTIAIEDHGHGMSTADLESKFLVVGRRRRKEQGTSENGRILMGRKGIGKLAGFGVAHTVQVTSRAKGEAHATQITLDYEKLSLWERTEQVEIPAVILPDGGGIAPYGTRVVLSRLVHESTASQPETIRSVIADNFHDVLNQTFIVKVNNSTVAPVYRVLVYAWPDPPKPPDDLVPKTLHNEETGESHTIHYRIRFTGPGQSLAAKDRGVRIYAHGRLANAPDLLDLQTGIHGFRNTHYLDGVVKADFIDDQPTDYIGSNRQALRWDTSLLQGLREFLTSEMQLAITEYQKVRDKNAEKESKEDVFTRNEIETSKLPTHRRKVAYRIASKLAAACEKGTADSYYKTTLPIFISGLGQGDILKRIADLAASQATPDLHEVLIQTTRLTGQEFADFVRIVEGRLNSIDALKRIYEAVNFKLGDNENELHELFKASPWLINPTFTQFLTSNQTEESLNRRLAEHLKIGPAVSADYDPKVPKEKVALEKNERPDLVFLLSNTGLLRVIVVELKAPNTPLHIDHLLQLKGYIRRTEAWLKSQGGEKARCRVTGVLIGSVAAPESRAEKVEELRDEVAKRPDNAQWEVFDVGEVLENTRRAHSELVTVAERRAEAGLDEEL
jgi:hypothetical protein